MSVSFDEAIVAGYTMSVTPAGGSPVAGATAWDAGTKTLTFTPSALLSAVTSYSVSVTGVQDQAGNATPPVSWSFTTGVVPSGETLFGFARPSVPASAQTDPIEVGTRFTVAVSGSVTGVRFYKGPGNSGTHVGRLWNQTTGALLGSVTFTGESATGWQWAAFSSPVPVTAGQPYVVSYGAPVGRYSATGQYFTGPHVSGSLTATAGVFSTAGLGVFPSDTFNNSNYWVDVTYEDTTAPGVVSRSPAVGADPVAVESVVSVSFDEAIVAGYTMSVTPAGGSPVAGATAWDAGTKTLTFTPSALLSAVTSYSVSVTGVQDQAGNATPPVSWSFTTGVVPSGETLFGFARPSVPASAQTDPIEVGTRFTVAVSGSVTGVRFYKGPGNSGTHVGRLWNQTTGALLGSVTFTGESATGWQWAAFSSPVPVTAGQPYVVSYGAPVGRYSATGQYFTGPHVSGSLTATAGVFSTAGLGVFPSDTFNNSNYWVDVTYEDTTAPGVVTRTPAPGATGVAVGRPVSVSFDEAIVAGYAVSVTPAGGSPVAGATVWDAGTKTLTFTPSALLSAVTSYSVSVTGVQDQAGNATPPVSWSFTTAEAPDVTAPVVVTRTPVSGASGVAVGTPVSVSFDEPIVAGYAVSVTPAGGSPVAGATAWDAGSKTLTFTPSALLSAVTSYSVSVSGVKDAAGNVADPVTWSFTTAEAPDVTAPVVVSRVPAPGAAGVSRESVVSVSFDEAIVAGHAMTLTPAGGSPVAGATAWDAGSKTLTFTPSSSLRFATAYTVAVSGVADAAGNATPTVSWWFTTPPVPDSSAPVVSTTALPAIVFGPPTFRWTATDDVGVTSVRLRVRTGAAGGRLGSWRPLVTLPGSAQSFRFSRVSAGGLCVEATAVDVAGGVSAPSVRCTTVPLDDRALAASRGGWIRATTRGTYLRSSSVSSRTGAYLVRSGIYGSRMTLLVAKRPGAGTLGVYVNNRLVSAVRLAATRSALQQLVSIRTGRMTNATVVVKVLTPGRGVAVDGLAISP